MCGRFAIATPKFSRIENVLGVSFEPVRPRFNISPTSNIPTVMDTGDRHYEIRLMRWGLVPHWSKEPTTKYSTFNARAETAAQKPAFRESFRSRRCLIPASGFYEWKKEGSKKQPYYFTAADGKELVFAGLWDMWEGPEGELFSCTILVCPPNELLAPIHDRMPVILDDEKLSVWLDPDQDAASLQSILTSYPAEGMKGWPVAAAVGNSRVESPSLIDPIYNRLTLLDGGTFVLYSSEYICSLECAMVTFPKDAEYLARLQDYYAKWRSLPSYAKLGRVLGIASRSAVGKVLNRLRDESYLSRTPDDVWVPVRRFFERPLADFQIPAGDPVTTGYVGAEGFMVDEYLVEEPSRTTLVAVRGDSMIDAGIFEGDMAVIERGREAKNGDIVAALVDGDLTLKRLGRERGKPVLFPENPNYPVIKPLGTLEILGVMVGLMRKFRKLR